MMLSVQGKHDVLEDVRSAIRSGMAEEACGLIRSVPLSQSAEAEIESCLAGLLRFRPATEVAAQAAAIDVQGIGSRESQSRYLLLKGILHNRQRDPISAIASVRKAIETLPETAHPSFRLDCLLELARIHSWMANFERCGDFLLEVLATASGRPELAAYRFLALSRLADHYAETERWALAMRYVNLAREQDEELRAGIYWLQLLLCQAKVELELDRPQHCAATLSRIFAQGGLLPPYLAFRAKALQMEASLRHGRLEGAAQMLRAMQLDVAGGPPGSFEAMLLEYLEARLALMERDDDKACALLSACEAWCVEQNLAVRVVDCRLLLAEAQARLGRAAEAATMLESARTYCAERNLQAQQERIAVKAAALGVSLMPAVEKGRSLEADAWQNRQAYVILGRLGSGGQGTVYKAFDNSRGRIVAVKRLQVDGGGMRQKPLHQVVREVNALARVAAEGVAHVLACGAGPDGEPYIVQEFVEGQSLRTRFGVLPPPDLVHICADVVDTLAHIHGSRVIHADVKPENIVIGASGKAVLVDFGIALAPRTNASMAGAGSSGYRPSVWATSFQPAIWLDYYAIGIMLLECLGGTVPKGGRSGLGDALFASRALRRAVADLPQQKGIFLGAAQRVILDLVSPLRWRKISNAAQPSARVRAIVTSA